MKIHHRNYPYRPPRRISTRAEEPWRLYHRFFRQYVAPRKWSLLACLLISATSACSVYLMSFYGRIMVDSILVVRPAGEEAVPPGERVIRLDRDRPVSRPRVGLGRRISQGLANSDRPPGAGRRLLLLAMAYMGTQITLNLLARVSARHRVTVAQWITGRLREDMHEKVLSLSLAYHHAYSPGRLLSRIVSDVRMVQMQMTRTLTQFVRCMAMLVVGVVILLTVDLRFALMAAAIIPLYGLVYNRARPLIKEFSRELRHTNSCLFALTSQKIDAMKAIQAYGREIQERLNFHRLTACFFRDAMHRQRLSAKLGRSATIISGVGTRFIFVYGAYLVLNHPEQMSLGEMMFVFSTVANLFTPVLQLTRLGVQFNYLTVVLQRVVDVLDRPLDIVEDASAVLFPSPLRRGLDVRHLQFSYPGDGERADAGERVIRDVSFHVPAGEWLCIMGPSGCGKSTLLYLLSRLYEPDTGEVLYDGVSLGRIGMSSLRHHMGVVPQEAQIFSGTVRDNICYGVPDATPDQIMAAAEAAQIHDFILTMKVQYETLVGQKGTSLSGGQRQRLSLARALLTDPDVLILDDCTSALDADTERRIQATLTTALGGKTAIIVSQRVSMAKRCQRIITLQDGVIGESGTHDELVAAGGFYAKLHAQQTE